MITRMRVRATVVVALMALSFAAAVAWRPTIKLADMRPKVNLEVLFPKTFGDWAVDDRMPAQLVSPDTQALLNKIYNQTLSRTYINRNGDRIMLSVAYGGDQSDATRAHRPEVCYPAQGFQVLSSQGAELSLGTQRLRVKRLVTKLASRTEPITYWITVGESVTVTGTEQKLAQLGYSTRGIVPDGMLVRVSSIDNDMTKAYGVHQQFIEKMVNEMAEDRRSLVVGKPGG